MTLIESGFIRDFRKNRGYQIVAGLYLFFAGAAFYDPEWTRIFFGRIVPFAVALSAAYVLVALLSRCRYVHYPRTGFAVLLPNVLLILLAPVKYPWVSHTRKFGLLFLGFSWAMWIMGKRAWQETMESDDGTEDVDQ
ncbi:MAG: hypothetical protein KKA42_08165 [candidate division Zixibacteria bacterium]|nr:hypothetical protein [candidate division Zixibacteria bacterium]